MNIMYGLYVLANQPTSDHGMSQSEYYNLSNAFLILYDSSESPPRFTLFQLLTTCREVRSTCVIMNDRVYIREMTSSIAVSNSTLNGHQRNRRSLVLRMTMLGAVLFVTLGLRLPPCGQTDVNHGLILELSMALSEMDAISQQQDTHNWYMLEFFSRFSTSFSIPHNISLFVEKSVQFYFPSFERQLITVEHLKEQNK